ncbi:MAG TPA: type II toxin-antitoxin system HicA family toxin [Bacillota bacterium]|nr:type II toxin-antitoxin system HicA family toxin [Bacillota bacterium]HQC36046.1 type II toxin-antitoxin system HicA family toxin [Bacillota bacterium]
MKVSELVKRLKASKKCSLIEHGAKHDIWYSEITAKYFPVPRHQSRDIKTGTLERILKDAGLK